ncbi:hypothetical protein MNBD_GAMMA11-2097 [hydrothermal vent metagenome]|uniref:Uncharacterized protein n=1 Tax=hydrothermal vent metagenome TaxID=652676 RepID=A0A3B0X262_9ZZZZ
MQIDFHHAVTYVTARLAGFADPEAQIIAYAAQYIDDCTSTGTISFDNKALYNRISSAHKMVDYRNVEALANHLVWLPFHFLPGNGGKAAGENPRGEFIEKIICRPDSPVAQDMISECIRHKKRTYGLHRLGVTMHVYADTWAHQGFAGVLHPINEVEHAEETGNSGIFGNILNEWLMDLLDDAVPPLGHGRASVLPDMPFITWEYKNDHKKLVQLNNTENFCEAADKLCIAMQRYRQGDANAEVDGIGEGDKGVIRTLFTNTKIKDGEKRHKAWLRAIAEGRFSFGKADVTYAARGEASWKAKALGTSRDQKEYRYSDDFIKSDWKLFHDAIQAHRLSVLHDILPRYGICAA